MRIAWLAMIVCFAFGLGTPAWAQSPAYLVDDVETGVDEGSSPDGLTRLNDGRTVFVANNRSFPDPSELWVTDGTEAGTSRLRTHLDLGPRVRTASSGTRVLFHSGGRSLWSTDGTAQGTSRILYSSSINAVHFDTFRNLFFISVYFQSAQSKLMFVSDGTAAGTRRIATTNNSALTSFASLPDWTFFLTGDQLWRSAGTEVSTTLLFSDAEAPFIGTNFLSVGSHLIFKRQMPDGIPAFWRTDGTLAGSERIQQPQPANHLDFYHVTVLDDGTILFVGGDLRLFKGTAALYRLDPRTGPIVELARFDSKITRTDYFDISEALLQWLQVRKVNGTVYFTPGDETLGFELWRTDGTVSGTQMVADLCPGACSLDIALTRSEHLGDELFVPMRTAPEEGYRLWRTRGTADTTRIDTNFDATPCGSLPDVRRLGSRLLVAYEDGLWASDGTLVNTALLRTGLDPVFSESVHAGGGLLFRGSDARFGAELWRTDGTHSGTKMLENIRTVPQDAAPRSIVAARSGDRVFYLRPNGDRGGDALWTASSDGVGLVSSPPASCDPALSLWSHPLDNRVVFSMATEEGGGAGSHEIWAADLDGTGARRLLTYPVEAFHRRVRDTVLLNGGVGFDAPHLDPSGETTRQLWFTNGTEAGTQRLTPPDIHFSWPISWPLATVNGRLLARKSNGRLWSSDGTTGGTAELRYQNGYPVRQNTPFIPFRNALFFDQSSTDGTPAGTSVVSALFTSGPSTDLVGSTRDHLYFTVPGANQTTQLFSLAAADDDVSLVATSDAANLGPTMTTDDALFFQQGDSLWVSHGTEQSTFELVMLPGLAPLSDDYAAIAGSRLFFQSHSDTGLWTSDGTRSGTVQVSNRISPSLKAATTLAVDDTLLFAASENYGDLELWRSDGTGFQTRQVANIEPSDLGASPSDLTLAGDTIYFAATTAATGRELWAVHADDAIPKALNLTAEDRFELTVQWTKPNGETGAGHPVRLTEDTGYFWFFDESNVELIVKILDARPANGHFWVFYGALSNVTYNLEVRDTLTGAVKIYNNTQGTFASHGDTFAFPADPDPFSDNSQALPASTVPFAAPGPNSTPATVTKGQPACANTQNTLCLQQQRFRVEVVWQGNNGIPTAGVAVPLSADTGTFSFRRPSNVELVVKVLDGRNNNGNFWVFYGALSNLAYTVTVTDTETGVVKVYDNPRGTFGSRGDTGAFPPL